MAQHDDPAARGDQMARAQRRVQSLLSGRVRRFDIYRFADIAAPLPVAHARICRESGHVRIPARIWLHRLPVWIRPCPWGRLARAALRLFRSLMRARIMAEDLWAPPRGSIGRLVVRTQRAQHAELAFVTLCFDDLLFWRRAPLSGRALFSTSHSLDVLASLFDAALSSEEESSDSVGI